MAEALTFARLHLADSAPVPPDAVLTPDPGDPAAD